jgi:hypothetical protein
MTIRERLKMEFILALGISPDYRLNSKSVKGECLTEIKLRNRQARKAIS